SPTRFGNISAQLKQFLDGTGPLWAAGELANKVATGFTSASDRHGGNESTLLALYNTLHHWGAILVAPGYTDESVTQAGGNPDGTGGALARGARPGRAGRQRVTCSQPLVTKGADSPRSPSGSPAVNAKSGSPRRP